MIELTSWLLSMTAVGIFLGVVVARIDRPFRFLGVVIVNAKEYEALLLATFEERHAKAFWKEEARTVVEENTRLQSKLYTLERARTITVKPVAIGVDSGVRIEVGR